MFKKISVSELMLTDRVVLYPEKGENARGYRVKEIRRLSGSKFTYEVVYELKGTWHYGPRDTVLIR